jgi:hypothetical protein
MKNDIKKILTELKIPLPISDCIILYADIKHPHAVLFNTSKYKKLYDEFQLTPKHLLKPVIKNQIYFQLIISRKINQIQDTIYI